MRIQIWKGAGGRLELLFRPKRSRRLPMVLLRDIHPADVKAETAMVMADFERPDLAGHGGGPLP